jgi:hypothetical protein
MIHDLVMPQWVNGRIAQRTIAMKQPWTDSILRGFDRSRDTKTAPALTGAALEQAYRALLLENQVLTETNQRLQEQLLEADAKRDTSSSERQLIREQRNLIAERSHELRQQQYACKTLQRERDQLRENNSHLAQKTARLAAAAEVRRAGGDDLPPLSPPSGPRSMIQSAVLMTSRLCSMTTTVLPCVAQAMQHREQVFDVVEVQAGGGLVEDVEGAAGVALAEFAAELDPLGLAAGQGDAFWPRRR